MPFKPALTSPSSRCVEELVQSASGFQGRPLNPVFWRKDGNVHIVAAVLQPPAFVSTQVSCLCNELMVMDWQQSSKKFKSTVADTGSVLFVLSNLPNGQKALLALAISANN